MHLGFLVTGFPKPSETFIARELLGLRREGLKVSAIACYGPSEDESAKLSPSVHAIADETTYLPLPGPRLALAGALGGGLGLFVGGRMPAGFRAQINAPALALRAGALARWARRNGVTQLHAHWPYASMLAYLVNRLTDIPYTISVHAHEVAHEDRHFPAVFETVRLATFCNRAAMELLLAKLPPEAREKSHLVYHGVDLDGFAEAPLPPMDNELRVVSAGRLTPTKGFVRLVEMCAAAKRAGVPVKLVILGEGAEHAKIAEAAKRNDFADDLVLAGWVEHGKVKEHLQTCHMTALLADTGFHDGLPNVVLEGMAVGRPPILSPLPAAREAVQDGVEGFILSAPDDFAGGVAALQRAWRERGLLESMSQAARARVLREHDAQVHIARLADLLRNAAGNKNA